MAATCLLANCSDRDNFQMIWSRRNLAILEPSSSDRDSEWRSTIGRPKEPSEDSRDVVFEYLAPLQLKSGRWRRLQCEFQRRPPRAGPRPPW
jgi:hypothetical protein